MALYEPKNTQEGYGDLAVIMNALSTMIRKEDFWSELLESVKHLMLPIIQIRSTYSDLQKS